jgi:hypothetical protein
MIRIQHMDKQWQEGGKCKLLTGSAGGIKERTWVESIEPLVVIVTTVTTLEIIYNNDKNDVGGNNE